MTIFTILLNQTEALILESLNFSYLWMECFDKYAIKAFPSFCQTRNSNLQRTSFRFIHFQFILSKQLQDYYKDQCKICTKHYILSKKTTLKLEIFFSEFVFHRTLGRERIRWLSLHMKACLTFLVHLISAVLQGWTVSTGD